MRDAHIIQISLERGGVEACRGYCCIYFPIFEMVQLVSGHPLDQSHRELEWTEQEDNQTDLPLDVWWRSERGYPQVACQKLSMSSWGGKNTVLTKGY
jgi:hypothetical protein